MRRARLILFLFLLIEPTALVAQWRLGAEGGYAHIEQPEQPASSAASLGLTFDFAREHSLIHASALGAKTSDGRQTGQWLTIGSLLSPSWRSWAVQGTGSFSAFGQTRLSATTSRDLLVQARTGTLARGFALGAGTGTTIHNAVAIPNRRGQADGWFSLGGERFNGSASLTRTRSVFGGSSILVDISRRDVNYADLSAGWTHDAGSWSLSGVLGMRGRNGTFTSADRWQAVNATAWLSPHVGLALDLGKTLEDLVRGVPRTHYLGLGLRVTSQPHLPLLRRARSIPGPRAVVSKAGESRRIEISNVRAARVELMADFTDWNPVVLGGDGGTWRFEGAIVPGLHRIAIRIDGGGWTVPANLPRVDDELGGMVGLITIP